MIIDSNNNNRREREREVEDDWRERELRAASIIQHSVALYKQDQAARTTHAERETSCGNQTET